MEKFPVVDFSKCKRYGSSYRALPKTVILSFSLSYFQSYF